MAHTPQTLYFDIKRRNGLLFVELRARATDMLLEPGEAVQVSGLPEGFTLCPNPETPGAAAFSSKVFKGPMMTKVMQDAGFRYDAEDVRKFAAREEERAKAAEEEAKAKSEAMAKLQAELDISDPGAKITDIERRGNMVVATVDRSQSQSAARDLEALADYDAIRFNVGTRMERDSGIETPVVRVAIEMLSDGEWERSYYEEFSDLPEFLESGNSMHVASRLNEADTIAALTALGWTHEPRVFLWYMPEQLAFGVQIDAAEDDDEALVFLMPIEDKIDLIYDHVPFEDDLRGDALGVEPDFFDSDVMENTFNLRVPLEAEEIKRRMLALGFTHDPELDELNG